MLHCTCLALLVCIGVEVVVLSVRVMVGLIYVMQVVSDDYWNVMFFLFLTLSCLGTCFCCCLVRTKKAWRTVNPQWNESFLFGGRALATASYLQLLVLDKARKGSKDGYMGVVFLPLSECFSATAVAGNIHFLSVVAIAIVGAGYDIFVLPYNEVSIVFLIVFLMMYCVNFFIFLGLEFDKDCDIGSALCMSKYARTHALTQSLGKLHLKIKLIMENKADSNGILNNYSCCYNKIPPEVELNTQMQPTHELSSYFVCDSCVRSGYCLKDRIKSKEQVLLAAGFNSLVLLLQPTPHEDGHNQSVEAIFSKFHTKTRRPRKSSLEASVGNHDKIDNDEILIFHFFENERKSLMLNWGSQHLFSSDRRKFSDESGKYASPYEPYLDIKMKPPTGYRWDTGYEARWQLDLEYTEAGEDGFSYGHDFLDLMKRLRKNQSRAKPRGRYFVRRRKWKRVAVKISKPNSRVGAAAAAATVGDEEDIGSARHRARDTYGRNYPDLDVFLAASGLASSEDCDIEAVTPMNQSEDDIKEEHTVTKLRYKIFHNQRRSITFKWEDGHLLSTDRSIYSDEKGKRNYGGPTLDDVLPPPGYRWVPGCNWVADCQYTTTDINGWCYGMDFSAISRDYNNGESQAHAHMKMVRRRRLSREMEETPETELDSFPHMERIGGACGGEGSVSAAVKTPAMHGSRMSSFELSRGSKGDLEDIPTTKLEAFKQSHDDIMKLCRERESIESPIIIPYEQIKSVDVVTPSVLSVIVTVHRYFGENESGHEIYNSVEMELYILECPAMKLCQLITDRLTLLPIRHQAVQLLSSGSITGDKSVAYDDQQCLNDDGSAVSLSLGSETLQRIYREMSQAESRILRQGALSEWGGINTASLHYRLKLYAFLLLQANLAGPIFDENRVNDLVRLDMRHADRLHSQLTAVQDASGIAITNAAKQSAQLLLDAAEMRISDYALCGWGRRDLASQELQRCLTILINGYFKNLVQELGYFFDSKDVLKSLAGNQSKLTLIEFFIEYDSHLNRVIERALRPYKLTTFPEPNLSLALSMEELMSWYVVLLRIEMLDFVSRTFQISQRTRAPDISSPAVYELPWEIIKDENQRPISVIPMDVFNLVCAD